MRKEPQPDGDGLVPEVARRVEDGGDRPMLVWRLSRPRLAISSAPLGGGIGLRHWVLNAEVAGDYARLDPAVHLDELATGLGLVGDGVGMLTAARVENVRVAERGGVVAAATVGLTHPVWAAEPGDGTVAAQAERVGTINIVALVPVRLSKAALVNAVATVTEAKAQALGNAGVAGTGTPTDAVCVLCAADGPVDPFGGPRSRWGAPLAQAVHRAVLAGS